MDYEVLLDLPHTPETARQAAEFLELIANALQNTPPDAWARMSTTAFNPDVLPLMQSLQRIAADAHLRQQTLISAQITAAQLRAHSVPRS